MGRKTLDPKTATVLATRIRARRMALGLTQLELAQRLGSGDLQRVSKWETYVHTPDVDVIPALARALATTSDHLLGLDDSTVVRETPATYNAFLETPLGESLPEDLRERLLSHDFAATPSVQTWTSLAQDLIAARKGKAIQSPELEIVPREGMAYRVRPTTKKK